MQKESSQPLVLAVETSGRAGSVALGRGDELLSEIPFSGPMRHSVELFETVKTMLAEADRTPQQIQHIYISVGPGSFTGIRIAVTLAKTMHLAVGVKIIAADTMDVLTENAPGYTDNDDSKETITKIGTIVDAKRGQFFTAVFEKQDNLWQKVAPAQLLRPSEFIEQYDSSAIWLLGEGLLYYADKFRTDNIRILDEQYWPARAAGVFTVGRRMAKQGNFANAETLLPNYMRRPEAEINMEKRQK